MECAGDDYWLPGKVKKQIDFMEANPDVGMCYSKAKFWNETKNRYEKKLFGSDIESFEKLLTTGNKIPALSVCLRKKIVEQYVTEIKPQEKNWLMEDYPMWLWFSHECKVKFFDEVTAVYRVLENSASHSVDVEKQFRFEKSNREIRQFYANKYNVNVEFEDDAFIKFYIYVNILKKKYDANIAKLMRSEYRKTNTRKFKMFVYYICSRFSISFKCL